MHLKILAGIGLVVAIISVFALSIIFSHNSSSEDITEVTNFIEENKIYIDNESEIFRVFVYEKDAVITPDGQKSFRRAFFELKQENTNLYEEIGLINQYQNTIVVIPTFTIIAYGEHGFYDYYKGECDKSCLEIPIRHDILQKYQTSDGATKIFKLLGYQFITDIDIDKNPDVLKQYDKVILLHNEYVTQKEFDAIIHHPKVIYLYPNSLYAKIEANYDLNTITLIRGHNYPQQEIKNGFNWRFDNTNFEYDSSCKNWEFYEIDNGIMLNCYPEMQIYKDKNLLKIIKDY